MSVLQGVLIVLEAVVASVLLPPMAWLLAKTYRRSAAGRRLVWVTAFAMLLGLPLLAMIAPSLTVLALPAPAPLPDAAPAVAVAAVATAPDPGPSGLGWFALIPLAIAVWLAGLAKLAVQHLIALIRLELMRRRAAPWRMSTPVPVRGCQLLISPDCPGPMTWGALRPVIMLPDEALDWPADRLATVLRHEMAHVRRRDGLAQALAVIACALYWPNPLVWGAARALRREAELAADDTVIAAGVLPSDYAGQLLELAAEWRERRLTPTGLAMAAPPALSQRVQSILSTDAIRTGATAMDTVKLVLLGGAATAALTLARPSVAEVPAAPANPAPPAPAAATAASESREQAVQLTPAPADKQTIVLAQQAIPAPRAATAQPAAPAPQPVFIPRPGTQQVPYNPVTDDPASPGFIPAGQPGAGHPVPAELAKQLNARKDAGASWELGWIPNPNGPPAPGAGPLPPLPPRPEGAATPFTLQWIPNPNGAPGQARTIIRGRLTPEQREQDRKLAEIGPAIDKAIKDAHIEEAVRKALSAQDAKTREQVAKQLAEIGPRIEQAVKGAQFQVRLAELQPQFEAAKRQAQERQAQAEDQVAAQLEDQAKRARERAHKAREQLKELQQAPAAASPPKN